MEKTYTYSARNVENPKKVVTFTLQDHHMSVGIGTPIEQIETVMERLGPEEAAGDSKKNGAALWLRPLAVSLLERGVGPFRVEDVKAVSNDDRLSVSAWYRAGGLALAPITLVNGRVDNPLAARAFVEEVSKRKAEVAKPLALLNLLDYWAAWIFAGAAGFTLFQIWRRKNR